MAYLMGACEFCSTNLSPVSLVRRHKQPNPAPDNPDDRSGCRIEP